MNERIKELERQAIEYANQQNTFDPRSEFSKKFAELIVRECAKVAGQEQVYNERHEIPVDIEQSVLEHFGVKK